MNEAETAAVTAEPGYEFPSLSALKEAHLKLLGVEAEVDDSVAPSAEFIESVREFMERASATGRVLDDERERGVAQTLLNYWATVLFRAGTSDDTMPRTSLVDWDENAGRDLDESQCPYRGVHAYGEENAHLFFGRREVVKKWLAIIETTPILVALGASGSGKTSLVRAGLIPKLRETGADWQVYDERLHDAGSAERLLETLERLPAAGEARPELVIIYRTDEGLLAIDSKSERRLRSALAQWLDAPGTKRRALLIGRTESSALISKWLSDGGLSARSRQEIIPPFDAGELRAVIEQPAERIGLRFDAGLVDTLINDFLGDPAALALLQFTLLKLWAERKRNRITWDAYHKIGGGRGVVETTANRVLQEDKIEPALAKNVFLKLVRPTLTNMLAVNVVAESELAPDEDAQTETRRVVASFERVGLLRVTDVQGVRMVEVAQEALLRKWPLFLGWLEDSRSELLQRRRIGEAAAQWRASDRHRSALWTGRLLSDALQMRNQLSREEAEFIDASASAAWWRRFLLAAAVVLLFVGVTYGMLRGYYHFRASRVALNTERGERLVEAVDPAGAFLFFSEAAAMDPAAGQDWLRWTWRRLVMPWRIWNDPARENEVLHQRRLGATWWQLPALHQLVYLNDLSRGALSPDGQYLVGSSNKDLSLWRLLGDAKTEETKPLAKFAGTQPRWAAFSADATKPLLAIALVEVGADGASGDRGRVIVFDPKTAQPVGEDIAITNGVPQRVAFSPKNDERLLVSIASSSGAAHGEVVVFNRIDGTRIAGPLVHELPVNSVAFSPDGELVVTAAGELQGGDKGQAFVWDWQRDPDGKARAELQHGGGPLALAEFNNGGLRVLTSEGANETTQGAARVWNVTRRHETNVLETEAVTAPLPHRGAVTRARFSPDGLWVATASRDRTARLWHVRTQKEVWRFEFGGDLNDVAFSPDGRYLVAAGRDRSARIWEVATGQPLEVPLNHSETVNEVAYSADGRSLLTVSKHVARLWNAERLEPKMPILDARQASVTAISGDGQRCLTVTTSKPAGATTLAIWETTTGRQIASARLARNEKVYSATLNRDGSRCLLVSDVPNRERTARAFRIETQADATRAAGVTEIAVFDPEPFRGATVIAAAFADGPRERVAFVLGSEANQSRVVLGDVAAKSLRTLSGTEPASFGRLQFSPSGNYLLACYTAPASQNGRAKLWWLEREDSPPSELAHYTRITSAAFDATESLLITGSTDDDAKVWPINDGAVGEGLVLRAAGAANTHTADLTSVQFSPRGNLAVTAAKEPTAILWHVAPDGRSAKRAQALHHSGAVNDVAFSADGNRILTVSSDRKLTVWSAATGALLALHQPSSDIVRAGFGPDGEGVFAIGDHLLHRANLSGLPSEEQFEHDLRPMTWTSAPLTLPPEQRRQLGTLLAGRRVSGQWLEKAATEDLPKIWAAESSRYIALLPERSSAEAFHHEAIRECKASRQWFAAAWHWSRLIDLAADPAIRAERLLERAAAYEQADNYAEALPLCIADREKAIELGRNRPDDYVNLGKAHLRFGNTFAKPDDAAAEWNAAIAAFEEAVKLAPDNPDLRLWLGEALAGKRDYAAADAEFRRAVELSEARGREDASARARVAFIGWLRGDEEGKKQYLEICGRVQNSEAPGAYLWAAVTTNAFEADEQCRRFVVDRAKQLAEAAPANFYRRNTLGAALYRAGEFEQAIQELEKARAGFAAEKVNDISQRYDRAIRLPITPPPEGRGQDWAFLAMANAQLALKTNQPERRAAAWDCMRKLRDAPELAQSAQQMGGSSSQPKTRNYPVAYDTLALELLYDETMSVLLKLRTPPPPPSSPPVAAAQ